MNPELLGYDNPFGRYPSPVAPVVKMGGVLFVLFAGDAAVYQSREIAPDSEYVKFDQAFVERSHFDPSSSRLFAYSATHAVMYAIDREATFFRELLRDPEFSADNPFQRLSLAKVVRTPTALVNELYSCVALLRRTFPEDFVDRWYLQQRDSIFEFVDSRYTFLFPSTWKVLIRIQETKLAMVTHPTRDFMGGVHSHSVGNMGAGAAMASAMVAVLMFNSRAALEAAYRVLLERNYETRDVSILMPLQTFEYLFPEFGGGDPFGSSKTSVSDILRDREYATLGELTIVCGGPYARNFGAVGRDMTVDLITGLKKAGVSEGQARLYEDGIKQGQIFLGVTSVSDDDASFLEKNLL